MGDAFGSTWMPCSSSNTVRAARDLGQLTAPFSVFVPPLQLRIIAIAKIGSEASFVRRISAPGRKRIFCFVLVVAGIGSRIADAFGPEDLGAALYQALRFQVLRRSATFIDLFSVLAGEGIVV